MKVQIRSTLVASLVGLAVHTASMALSPRAEADRQMLIAAEAIKGEKWSEAVDAFEAIEATGITALPESFDYLYGNALLKVQRYADANAKFSAYVQRFGEKGKYYREALMGITAADKGEKPLREKRLAEQAAAARRAQEEVRAEQAAAAERARLAGIAAEVQRRADAGEIDAMIELSGLYRSGEGVRRSEHDAAAWQRKAEQANPEYVEFISSPAYRKSASDPMTRLEVALLKLPSPPKRVVGISGAPAVASFVATDPFFEWSGSGAVQVELSALKGTMASCTAKGRLSELSFVGADGNGRPVQVTETRALGGLMMVAAHQNNGSSFDAVRIGSVSGQPFPAKLGTRFGIEYEVSVAGVYNPTVSAICGFVDSVTQAVCRFETSKPLGVYAGTRLVRIDTQSGCVNPN